MANYIYLVQMDVPSELEDDFNRIYDTEHVPNIVKVPGVSSCKRYLLDSTDVDGTARYAAIYEIDAPDVPKSAAWKEASDTGDWKDQIRPYTTNRAHVIYKTIG